MGRAPRGGIIIQPRQKQEKKRKLHRLSTDSIRNNRRRDAVAGKKVHGDADASTGRNAGKGKKGEDAYYDFPFATWQRGRRFDEDEMVATVEEKKVEEERKKQGKDAKVRHV